VCMGCVCMSRPSVYCVLSVVLANKRTHYWCLNEAHPLCRFCILTCGEFGSRIPPGVPWQEQRPIHQLRLNRLTSTASYQAFIGQITSPICPHCGTGEETAEHLLLFCSDWAAERQRYFGDSTDATDVFQDSDNLVEFLITSGHLPPPTYKHCPTGSS